ncbi:MAG TPA: hypothetical protein VGG65_00960 [Thermoanaerobaculia bacterium]
MPSPAGESTRAIVPLPLLRGIAAIVVAASIAAGARALRADLIIAFRDAGPSNTPASVARQLEAIRRLAPPGAPILLVAPAAGDDLWYTRFFQRALYPRNAVLIRYLPFARKDADTLRRHWKISHGVAFGAAPTDLGFLGPEDLGTLPASLDRVWAGAMAAPP